MNMNNSSISLPQRYNVLKNNIIRNNYVDRFGVTTDMDKAMLRAALVYIVNTQIAGGDEPSNAIIPGLINSISQINSQQDKIDRVIEKIENFSKRAFATHIQEQNIQAIEDIGTHCLNGCGGCASRNRCHT